MCLSFDNSRTPESKNPSSKRILKSVDSKLLVAIPGSDASFSCPVAARRAMSVEDANQRFRIQKAGFQISIEDSNNYATIA
jgi:hypothetical protein